MGGDYRIVILSIKSRAWTDSPFLETGVKPKQDSHSEHQEQSMDGFSLSRNRCKTKLSRSSTKGKMTVYKVEC